MIVSFSQMLSSLFVAHGIIDGQEKDVYAYSFEVFFAALINTFVLVVLSVITSTIAETALFMLAFIPLRQAAGGYHAKNHSRCLLILVATYIVFQMLLRFLDVQDILLMMLFGLPMSCFMVFLLSPLGDKNKPLSEAETIRFKKASRMSVAIYAALDIVVYLLAPNKWWAFSLLYGIMSVAFSLLAQKVKQAMEGYMGDGIP